MGYKKELAEFLDKQLKDVKRGVITNINAIESVRGYVKALYDLKVIGSDDWCNIVKEFSEKVDQKRVSFRELIRLLTLASEKENHWVYSGDKIALNYEGGQITLTVEDKPKGELK